MQRNLLQRLITPKRVSSPFGHINQLAGFTPEIKQKLLEIVYFDSMINGEYDNGVIFKAMRNIALKKQKKLFHEVINNTNFLIIIPEDQKNQYVEKIKDWSNSNYDQTDSYSGLNDVILGVPPKKENLIGWLDLTDEVLFFRHTDEGFKMAEAFLNILTER